MSNKITPTVFYRTLNVEGLEIFHREAGPRDAPTVLRQVGEQDRIDDKTVFIIKRS